MKITRIQFYADFGLFKDSHIFVHSVVKIFEPYYLSISELEHKIENIHEEFDTNIDFDGISKTLTFDQIKQLWVNALQNSETNQIDLVLFFTFLLYINTLKLDNYLSDNAAYDHGFNEVWKKKSLFIIN